MKNRMGTVAQILLCVLFLSIAALLLSVFVEPGKVIGSAIVNALNEVAPLRAWIELLYNARDMYQADATLSHAVSGSLSLAVNGIISVSLTAFFESMLIGICIHLANRIASRGNNVFRGGMVLPTIIGALVGCVLCGGTDLISRKAVSAAMSYIITNALIIIGIIIMLTSKLPKANGGVIRRYLGPIILGALASSILAMYVSVLTMVVQGFLVPALPWVTGSGIVTIVLMILFYFLESMDFSRHH